MMLISYDICQPQQCHKCPSKKKCHKHIKKQKKNYKREEKHL